LKYFTSEWWASGCEDETVFNEYSSYYDSIADQLPEKICILNEKHTLHDSNVKDIYSDFLDNIVTINLRGWNQEFSVETIYIIKFIGVSCFSQSLPKDEYVESELGDLGYIEYELLDTSIEMRMLFASGAEFILNFKDFNFEHKKA
jgi:hypothetical protein